MRDLEQELKELIVKVLVLEDITAAQIDSEEPLFGEGLGLDSIDGLELGMALRKTYGVKIEAGADDLRKIFANVRNIAEFVARQAGVINAVAK